MKIYAFFDLPNWKEYQKILLDFYHNTHEYDYNSIAEDRENNFLKILRRKKLKILVPNLIDYFDKIGKEVVFIETIGIPAAEDPYSEIHQDKSPLFEDFYMANYAINFPLMNTEHSKIVFFDEYQTELIRLNYDHCPLLFRTDGWHSVVNYSKDLRLVASIRFREDVSMEEFLK